MIDQAKDAAKDKALDKAEDLYMGEEDETENNGCFSNIVRFFVSLIWLVIILAVDILSAVSTLFNPLVGAGLEFGIFIITLCVPYLRKKGTLTRWWGWLALLSAIGLLGFEFGL